MTSGPLWGAARSVEARWWLLEAAAVALTSNGVPVRAVGAQSGQSDAAAAWFSLVSLQAASWAPQAA